jgi:importin-5
MSSLSPSLDDWETLLRRFMGVDNADRKLAESLFAELRASQPDATLSGLLGVVHSTRGDDVRGLAAVLLRRVLLSDAVSLWPDASESVRAHVKHTLLAVLHTEQDRSIRRKVCDTVGELASSILEDGQWDELLPTLLAWSQDATSATLRETTLRVLEIIAISLATTMEDETSSDDALEATILTTLVRLLQDTEGRVALNAVRALAMLLINLEAPFHLHHQELLTNTVPLVLAELHRLLNASQYPDVMELLEVLIEVTEPHALYFKPMLQEIVETMVQIADTAALPDGCRQLAMEFLVSLAENASAACRKLPKNGFVTGVFPVVFRMMLELDDVETWSPTVCEEVDDLVSQEISNFDVGSEALERLVNAIGAKKSLPTCFALIHEYASRGDSWLHRHAALVGLCQILEVLAPRELDEIVRHLLAQCHDPHPRVCCTAIDVIGQLAMDQAPHFQEQYHAQALGVLLYYLQQREQPRLQAHAATALRQFIDMCSPELLAPYLENLLQQLFAVLQLPQAAHVVREQTLTALSSAATVAGASFAQYYSAVMPTLQQLLVQCLAESSGGSSSSGAFTLGGITLECISLIGVAVGRDLFGRDAVEIMKLMAQMQQTPHIVENEGIRTYLLQAWARFCKCLGKEFASYLPVVMPTLLQAASQQAEFEVDPLSFESDSDTASDTSSEHDDVQIAQVNDKTMSIRTSVLEEKATACQLLAGMVLDLEEAFFPYAEQVTQVLAPLMTECVHSDIRAASIAAMPALVRCVAQATQMGDNVNSEASKQMLDFAMGRLVHALPSEPDLELVVSIMQSLKLCVDHAQSSHAAVRLNDAQLREVVHALLLVLGDSFQRRAVSRAERAVSDEGDEYEDEEEETSGQEDDLEPELQFLMADCIGHLAKTHGESFFPVFESLLWDKILELSAAHCLAEDRKLALYILDDVIEHCGAPAIAQTDVFLPLLVNVLQTSEGYPPLIQAAAFGIGLLAKLGGARFAPHARASQQLLLDVVALPHAQDAYMVNATDNAVSAIGLICVEHHTVVDAAPLFPQWLAMLPLRGDLEESCHVLQRLCGYVRDRNAFVLQEPVHVAGLVRVFAQAMASGRAFEKHVDAELFAEVKTAITDALAQLRATLPADAMAQAWGVLSGPQQAALHALFT